jgi:hypothetical protein
MLKFFQQVNKYRKYINVALKTYDDFQNNYKEEFNIELDEKLSK